MISLCVPFYDLMSTRILEPGYDLAHRNTLDDASVHGSFHYYLFSYDDTHACMCIMFYIKFSINRENGSLLDSMVYNLISFYPCVGLNYDEYSSITFFHSSDSYLVLLLDFMFLNKLCLSFNVWNSFVHYHVHELGIITFLKLASA